MRDLLVMRISHTCDVDRLASHLSLFSRGQLESIGPPKECSESVYKNIELLKLVVFACLQITIYTKKYITHGEQEGTMGEVSRQ